MNLPKSIHPCPISDALFEIRFFPKTHPGAVFGLVYNVLKDDFNKGVVNLPILQIPEVVRKLDSNLKYKPHYKISNDSFVVQIGPEVLSISSFPKYVGWKKFSEKIFDVLKKIEDIEIINSIVRIGIRYVNFFEKNIYDEIDLKVLIANKEIEYNNTIIRTEIIQQGYRSTLQIGNNATLQVENGTTKNRKSGSFIDIDTFKNDELESFFSNKEKIINKVHKKEKELFFSLLKDDFLSNLNPEY